MKPRYRYSWVFHCWILTRPRSVPRFLWVATCETRILIDSAFRKRFAV